MARKNNRMLLYGGLVALAIAGYTLTEPPKTTKSGVEPTVRAKNTSSSTRGQKVSVFTEEDELAHFDPLNEPISNAFKPSVVESGARKAGDRNVPNQVPPGFVNGETTWYYTGTVSFDGSTMVLIENSSNGQGEYLRVGQTIGSATVMDITNNSVTLAGPNGEVKRLILLENRPIVTDREISASTNNAPYNPMQGNIGKGPSANSTSANLVPTISSNNGPTVLDTDNTNISEKDAQNSPR